MHNRGQREARSDRFQTKRVGGAYGGSAFEPGSICAPPSWVGVLTTILWRLPLEATWGVRITIHARTLDEAGAVSPLPPALADAPDPRAASLGFTETYGAPRATRPQISQLAPVISWKKMIVCLFCYVGTLSRDT